MRLKFGVCFDDVLMVPQYSNVSSRKEIDLSSKLENINYHFRLPIISSPMDTITEDEMAYSMLSSGGMGIVHRYNSIKEQAEIVANLSNRLIEENHKGSSAVAAAVGVSGDYIDRATALYDAGARILCVDIAHGHHILMKNALFELRKIFGNTVHLMAGNVATVKAFDDLATWGANSIRVGIGGGSICSTRTQTGHGVPTLQSVIDCAQSQYAGDVKLIADGGIRNSGDIVKALAAGADFVMVGSLLSGTDETPGEVEVDGIDEYEYYVSTTLTASAVCAPGLSVNESLTDDTKKYKAYRGMASPEAQIEWRGYPSSVEGVATRVECKGPVGDILQTLLTGIRSGLSYSGAKNISTLQSKAKFIKQSSSGAAESNTHILTKE
ncbi:MAG: guanosine monophosphate reductase [Halobacteriovorax sp.]|nr:guanosine monophosphate reductase [Halobacteriovorax sp.]|tara:strand:+ start:677 stop:1822 length:1146 start_codon:yes stop_codon:yes gene_type:complete